MHKYTHTCSHTHTCTYVHTQSCFLLFVAKAPSRGNSSTLGSLDNLLDLDKADNTDPFDTLSLASTGSSQSQGAPKSCTAMYSYTVSRSALFQRVCSSVGCSTPYCISKSNKERYTNPLYQACQVCTPTP